MILSNNIKLIKLVYDKIKQNNIKIEPYHIQSIHDFTNYDFYYDTHPQDKGKTYNLLIDTLIKEFINLGYCPPKSSTYNNYKKSIMIIS